MGELGDHADDREAGSLIGRRVLDRLGVALDGLGVVTFTLIGAHSGETIPLNMVGIKASHRDEPRR